MGTKLPGFLEAGDVFRERWRTWILIGLSASFVEGCPTYALSTLHLGPVGTESLLTEALRNLLFLGLDFVQFVFAVVILRATFAHVRGNDHDWRHGFQKLPLASLIAVALTAFAAGRTEWWILKSILPVGFVGIATMLLNWAATVPVLLVVPFLADRGLRPDNALIESGRAMRPVVVPAFLTLVGGFIAASILTMPLMMLALLPVTKTYPALAMALVFAAMGCTWFPFYYIWVALVYLDRTSGAAESAAPDQVVSP